MEEERTQQIKLEKIVLMRRGLTALSRNCFQQKMSKFMAQEGLLLAELALLEQQITSQVRCDCNMSFFNFSYINFNIPGCRTAFEANESRGRERHVID
jgi:hypothetical protein